MKKFYQSRILEISSALKKINIKKLNQLENLILNTNELKGKIIICGNGGSAATASHFAVDLSLNAKIRAVNFNEADLITCFANDFGYENWLKKALELYANSEDLLILISCSGNSKNLVNGIKKAKELGLKTVTLTGCKKNNILNNQKNNLNIWINSNKYNVIEIIHHSILLNVIDGIVSRKV